MRGELSGTFALRYLPTSQDSINLSTLNNINTSRHSRVNSVCSSPSSVYNNLSVDDDGTFRDTVSNVNVVKISDAIFNSFENNPLSNII